MPSPIAEPDFPSAEVGAGGGARLELRKRLYDWTKTSWAKRWQFEDNWTQRERSFLDQLKGQLRGYQSKLARDTASSEDWKRARKDSSDKLRQFQADLRQRVKVHREELELELLRFQREREAEMNRFFEGLEKELKEAKSEQRPKDSAKPDLFQKAAQDLGDAKADLRTESRKWANWMKSQKPKENFWE